MIIHNYNSHVHQKLFLEMILIIKTIKCGTCNSNFTAEIKKEKYIYYHCSGNDECNKTYLKQETINDLFSSLFDQIHISEEVQTIILQSLRESFKDKIEYHNALISKFEQ